MRHETTGQCLRSIEHSTMPLHAGLDLVLGLDWGSGRRHSWEGRETGKGGCLYIFFWRTENAIKYTQTVEVLPKREPAFFHVNSPPPPPSIIFLLLECNQYLPNVGTITENNPPPPPPPPSSPPVFFFFFFFSCIYSKTGDIRLKRRQRASITVSYDINSLFPYMPPAHSLGHTLLKLRTCYTSSDVAILTVSVNIRRRRRDTE